jgi:hypothetical protein
MKNKLIGTIVDIHEKPAYGYYASVVADGELETIVVLSNRIFGSSESAHEARVSRCAGVSDNILWQVDSFREMVEYTGRDLADEIIIDYVKKVGTNRQLA